MAELVKLRQQQQDIRSHLQVMEGRLKRSEQKQQQMMNFLARAMRNPNFVQQLVQQKEWQKELEEVFSKKKRRGPIDQGHISYNIADHEEHSLSVKLEPQEEYADMSEFLVAEMQFGLNIEGESGTSQKNINEEELHAEKRVGIESRDKQIIDEGFWQDLLNNEGFDQQDLLGVEEEDVIFLADQLGYLASGSE